ncbi:hypothetical protein L228DRAFT_266735 [Xylona heveae TC161]|uniref:Hepatocellular carcinoma-associated antigen 59-domain-containing protein n=1 Tax=Xylona heveae (strain CBS 132557 / TC161) TaxID=1328760 RepID=A0A165I515_XYLHT|nr:hypothetical protein L228DRAFT_266735 [Xylona heveae TC161]KZF24393.1 hypothetical protein L228DRAFT_266735 [Xylona heveae TC161]
MADVETQTDTPREDLVPRPFKRRKFYRKRVEEANDDDGNAVGTTMTAEAPAAAPPTDPEGRENDQGSDNEGPDKKLSVQEILRLRKAARNRRGGIGFANSTSSTSASVGSGTVASSDALMESAATAEEVQAAVNRFAPQTGMAADVDKHMMAYVEAELAKRREGVSSNVQNSSTAAAQQENLAKTAGEARNNKQPAALGKLHEIDLGPDAKMRNIERTEAAKRRIGGEELEVIDDPTKSRKLGKDGKPLRDRRRRNSDDMKRDQLVEEILRESRLEIYDEPQADQHPDDEMAADERIAEQFRREFMDAISTRRRRAAPAASSSAATRGKKDDRPKGPKLGGSRSARAAMREQQEKSAKR